MARLLCAMFALTVLVYHAAGSDEDDIRTLQGTWVVVSGEKGGKKGEGPDFETFAVKFRLTIDGNQYQSSGPGSEDASGTIRVDSSRSPKKITFTRTDGTQTKGIYEFQDGMLRLNSGRPGDPRPAAFKTEGGAAIFLVLKKHKKDKDAIQGTWAVVSVEAEGKPLATGTKQVWVITAEKITWKEGDKVKDAVTMKYHLDAEKKPKTIDLDHPAKEVGALQGIYQLEGDRLKICFGKERPKEFATKGGTDHRLVVFKRQKP